MSFGDTKIMELHRVNLACCGCTSCSNICPQKCIEIKQDENGFWSAYYDEDKCINCDLCKKNCPMIKKIGNKSFKVYAAASDDVEIYSNSSSGGVFSHIARVVLGRKGIVYGCGYDNQLVPTHLAVVDYSDIEKLRRSKYVQSRIGETYKKIRENLNDGIEVLFAGTPCQVAGLKIFLGKQYEKLTTIDLICHGTPSSKMFASNVAWVSDRYGSKLLRYEFRLKTERSKKIKSYSCYYKFDTGREIVIPYYKDPFFNEFYDTTSLNECCYSCPYASEERPGDITIGDFEWGKKYHPELNDFGEISCVLVNTEKGETILDNVVFGLRLIETTMERIEEKNLNLIRPTIRPKYRDSIYKEITEKGYSKWAKEYFYSLRYWKKTRLLKNFVKIKIMINNLMK